MSARVSRPNWQRLSWCWVSHCLVQLYGGYGGGLARLTKMSCTTRPRTPPYKVKRINLCQYADRWSLTPQANVPPIIAYQSRYWRHESLHAARRWGRETVAASARYGSFAMEVLINHLMKLGARRNRLGRVFNWRRGDGQLDEQQRRAA